MARSRNGTGAAAAPTRAARHPAPAVNSLYGCIEYISALLGCDPKTIHQGMVDLADLPDVPPLPLTSRTIRACYRAARAEIMIASVEMAIKTSDASVGFTLARSTRACACSLLRSSRPKQVGGDGMRADSRDNAIVRNRRSRLGWQGVVDKLVDDRDPTVFFGILLRPGEEDAGMPLVRPEEIQHQCHARRLLLHSRLS